jgi:hypothetical protein
VARNLFPLIFIVPAQQLLACGPITGSLSPKAAISFIQSAAPPPPLLTPLYRTPLSLALPCSDGDEMERYPAAFLFPNEPTSRHFPFVFETTDLKVQSLATIVLL